ncbi:MAG TPA: tetratricopeptide repeat protein [Myxococcales bacterium]|nr:tetratricopeptide repeat protein [Myxococcales bacterium]
MFPTFLIVTLAASPTARAEARQLFEKGSAAYSTGRYDVALDDFSRAYGLAPIPGFLFNIGECQRALHHWGPAAASFRQYLTEHPNAKNADTARGALADAEAKAAAEQPQAHAAAASAQATPAPAAVPSPPPPAAATSDLQPVPRAAVTDTQPVRRRNLAPWLLTGGGAAAVVAGAILGSLALSVVMSDKTSLQPSLTPANEGTTNSITFHQAENANAFASASVSLLSVGAAAVAGGLAWRFWPRPSGSNQDSVRPGSERQ